MAHAALWAGRRDDLYEAVARLAMPHPAGGGKFKVHWLVPRAAQCPSSGATMAIRLEREDFLCPVCLSRVELGSGSHLGTLRHATPLNRP